MGSVAFMRHFFNLWQQIVSKRQNDHALQLSLQKLCLVGVAFISNTDSPTEQNNISSSQTHASSKAPDVCDTALAMQRSYTSILQGLDKLWANSDSAGEVRSVVYEIIVLFEAILAKINTLVVRKAKEAVKIPSQKKDSQSKVLSIETAFHTALARSPFHMPQPHPTRHPHAHNPQPIKEVSLLYPRRLPLRLPRPSRVLPSP
jgi:hypothetical protein